MATNPLLNTATLSIRLDADSLAAFDRFAVGRGGRSALLRQMIEQTVKESAGRPFIDRPEGAARNRVSLRFTDVEIAVIEVRASQRSTDRAGCASDSSGRGAGSHKVQSPSRSAQSFP